MTAPIAAALDAPAANGSRRSTFRRYAPTVATIVVVALCVSAGNWQRARMHYKAALQAQYDAAVAAPPLRTLDAAGADPAAVRYRPVELEGTFDAKRQILLDNKVHAGRPGYDVLTPFVLKDGRTVLVDRGWVALGRSRSDVPDVVPPVGTVTLRGRLDVPPRYFALTGDVSAGVVWQHLDLERFAAAYGLPLVPVIVDQTAPTGPADDLVRAWPAPDFGIDTHRIYMVQWYAFALLAIVFWVVAHVRRSARNDARSGRQDVAGDRHD